MLDTLTSVSWPFVLALLALAAHWLWTVRRQARIGLRPSLAFLAAPGLTALLAAPLTQADPLFGVGAALILIAAYAPTAYIPASGTHHTGALRWGSGTGAALLLCAGASEFLGLSPLGWSVWTGLFLMAMASLLGAGPRRQAAAPALGLAVRFRPSVLPAWPDLELKLEGDLARVQNIGQGALYLAGWSGSAENGWLRAQDAAGRPLTLLPKGSSAVLSPWPPGQHGIRVWYVRQASPAEGLLFRADWTPPGAANRVLN